MPETVGLLLLSATGIGGLTGIAGLGTIAGTTIGGVGIATVVGSAAIVGVSIGLQYALRPPTAQLPTPEAGSQAVKQAVPPRIRGYGRNRLAGYYMLFEAVDGPPATSFDVMAFHSGKIGQVITVYLSDDPVIASPPITFGGYGQVLGSYADGRYGAAHIYIEAKLGDAPQSSSALIAGSSSSITSIWTPEFQGNGIAYLVMRCAGTQDVPEYTQTYPHQLPAASVLADCSVVWDPRDQAQQRFNPSTWRVSYNPVVQLIDYLTRADGGMGMDYDEIIAPNIAQWIGEANLCDEIVSSSEGGGQRYVSSGWFQFDNTPDVVIGKILSTCDGWLAESGDGTLSITVGFYRAPTDPLTEKHIFGFALNYGQADEQMVNQLEITFTDPMQKYVSVQTDPWRDEASITATGTVRSQALDLSWVQTNSQARRLASRAMQRLNPLMTGSFTTSLYGLRYLGQRWIALQYPFVSGLQDCVVEIQNAEVDLLAGRIVWTFIRIEPDFIEAYDPDADEGTPPIVPPTPPGSTLYLMHEDDTEYMHEDGSTGYVEGKFMTGRISEDPDKPVLNGSEKFAAASGGLNFGVLLSSIASYLATLTQTLTNKTIVSPFLTGTPNAPTPPTTDNSTLIATTAYVRAAMPTGSGTGDVLGPGGATAGNIAVFNDATGKLIADGGASVAGLSVPPAAAAPLMDVTPAVVGTATKYAREDHRHPTDTSLAPLASPMFSGNLGLTGLTAYLTLNSGNATITDASIYFEKQGTPKWNVGVEVGSAGEGFGFYNYGLAGTVLALGVDGSATLFATPAATDSSNKIATTAFVQAGASAAVSRQAANDILINGDMELSQRILTTLTTLSAAAYIFTLDCWRATRVGTMIAAVQQVASGPSGYSSQMALTVSAGQTTLGANDQVSIQQPIENIRIQRLQWGTANASPMVLSFWTAHHRTGTYSGTIVDGAGAACYAFTYSQNVADAWEFKTVSIPGPTIGTWTATTAARLNFAMAGSTGSLTTPGVWAITGANVGATGQVNAVQATTDVFRITGVRLLPGTDIPIAASAPLLRLPFDTVFQQVRRYYQKNVAFNTAPTGGLQWEFDFPATTGRLGASVALLPPMRSSPSVTIYDTPGTAGMCFKGADGKVAGVASLTPTQFECYTFDATNSGLFSFNWVADAGLT